MPNSNGGRVTLNDPGKLYVLCIGLVGSFAIALAGIFTEQGAALGSGLGLAGTLIGYVYGNGRLASRANPPSTLLSPVLPESDYIHLDELPPPAKREIVAARLGARDIVRSRLSTKGE
jgi:hypothetical protein